MHSDRIRVRAISVDDAELLHELWSDVDTHLLTQESPYLPRSLAGVRAQIERNAEKATDATANASFMAETIADGTRIGIGGLWGVSAYEQFAHLSITLLPAARGQGYGRELVGLLCRYGFRLRNLRRLELETLASNTAMRKAAEANGFVLEGLQRERAYDGTGYDDLALYGLLRHEWSS